MTLRQRVAAAAAAALTIVILVLLNLPAQAELRVDITRGKIEPMPIAVPAFGGEMGGEMAGVVSADLERSGLFRPIDPHAFIQNVSTGEAPRFADWRQINAQALVTGSVQP